MFILKHSISVSNFALSYCTTAIDVIHALEPYLGFSARGHPRHDLGNRQGTELVKVLLEPQVSAQRNHFVLVSNLALLWALRASPPPWAVQEQCSSRHPACRHRRRRLRGRFRGSAGSSGAAHVVVAAADFLERSGLLMTAPWSASSIHQQLRLMVDFTKKCWLFLGTIIREWIIQRWV